MKLSDERVPLEGSLDCEENEKFEGRALEARSKLGMKECEKGAMLGMEIVLEEGVAAKAGV